MARFTGFKCDLCGRTAEGVGRDQANQPEGWLTVNITTDHDHQAGTKLLCGNKCLRDFGAARYKIEQDERREMAAVAKAEQAITKARMDHIRYHVNAEVVDPDCRLCEAATSAHSPA